MTDSTTDAQGKSEPIRAAQRVNIVKVLYLNIIFLFMVAITGFFAHSLVLLASAVHLIADVASLAIAYVAILLASRPASQRHSFGLVRAEVLGALINGAILLATSIWIMVEASRDLIRPHPLTSMPVIILGAAGMAMSAFSLTFLSKSSGKSLNMRAGVIHMAGDTAGWLVTILSGVAIQIFRFYRADAIGSIIISIIVLGSSWRILSQTVSVLLESTPRDLRPDEIRLAIESDAEILNVHHLHLWNLASDTIALSAHILMQDGATLHSAQVKVQKIKEMLNLEYGIDHVTIEVECHKCGDGEHDPQP